MYKNDGVAKPWWVYVSKIDSIERRFFIELHLCNNTEFCTR